MKKRLSGILLALCLLAGLLPGGGTAHAAGSYSAYIPVGNESDSALAGKVVSFFGMEWYIIADDSTA
ncbi:MAG: hypothetical protein E7425_03300, partial [Ruminococcaceae bacterium]|nr:hypothetical protein [Oscillospiraceae bacterium]